MARGKLIKRFEPNGVYVVQGGFFDYKIRVTRREKKRMIVYSLPNEPEFSARAWIDWMNLCECLTLPSSQYHDGMVTFRADQTGRI